MQAGQQCQRDVVSAVVQESRLSGNPQEERKLFLGISEDFFRQMGWVLREEGPPGRECQQWQEGVGLPRH